MAGKENKGNQDDEYQTATQTIVDDAMRLDILGPNVQRVLKEHKLCNDTVIEIVIHGIKNDSNVQQELSKINNKNKWFDRIMGALGTIIIGAIATGFYKFLNLK